MNYLIKQNLLSESAVREIREIYATSPDQKAAAVAGDILGLFSGQSRPNCDTGLFTEARNEDV